MVERGQDGEKTASGSRTSFVRCLEHVGMTVPDIEAATRFLVEALGAQPVYDLIPPGSIPENQPPAPERLALVARLLGIAEGDYVSGVRMLRLGDGTNIELFEYRAASQRPPLLPSDIGLTHFAVYVDDIDAVAERVRLAGGELLEGPSDLPDLEYGPGNRYIYTRTPWGSTIELITVPSPQAYETQTPLRRWLPPPTA